MKKKWLNLLLDILGFVFFALLLIAKIFEKDIPNFVYYIVLIVGTAYFALEFIWILRRSKQEQQDKNQTD